MQWFNKLRKRLPGQPQGHGAPPWDATAALTAWLSDLLERHIDRGYQPTDQEHEKLRALTPEQILDACSGRAFSKATVLCKWLTPEQCTRVRAWLHAPPAAQQPRETDEPTAAPMS